MLLAITKSAVNLITKFMFSIKKMQNLQTTAAILAHKFLQIVENN